MKSIFRAALIASAVVAAPLTAVADPLNYEGLKAMVTGLGYAPKDIGEKTPKMEIQVTTENFNVPAGLEITPSGRFIWITANLGDAKIDGERALNMLKRAKDWQPTQFWITASNNLMVGIAINNTTVAPDNLKFAIDKLGTDVGKSSDLWQVQ